MIRGVIFDMDGLMFDTERMWDTFWSPVCAKMGLPDPPATFYPEGRGLAGENMVRHVAKYYPDADPHAIVKAVWALAEHTFQTTVVPCKPGLYKLLAYLKQRGLPCIVASSSPREMVRHNVENHNLTEYFVDVVGGEDTPRSKPDPAIFLAAAKKIGVAISDCLILEDSHNGVRAGHAAGAVTVMVPDLMPVTDEMRRLYTMQCESLLEVKEKMEQGELQ